MKEIRLTQNKVAFVDDKDYEYISQFSWHVFKSIKTHQYAARNENGRLVLMHRVIANTPLTYFTDHINHNGLDNRKKNLRIVTRTQNMQNKYIYRNNKSGYKGVVRRNNGWIAKITVNKKRIYLGYFKDKGQAALAYNKAAKKHFGLYAYINNNV